MRLMISSGDNKQSMDTMHSSQAQMVDIPQIVTSNADRKFLTKKKIISAVVTVVVAVIVVIGILVAIWMFSEQNRLTLQYKQNLIANDNSKSNQDVSTDLDENIVQYHVVKDDNEWWIIEDFNKGIKMSKEKGTNGVYKCLVSSLDESKATKPSDVKASSSPDQKAEEAVSISEMFTVAEDPVKDVSFLGKTAKKLCADTPVHWTYRTCLNATESSPRDKRAVNKVCTPCGCGYKGCLTCGTVYYSFYLSGGYWYCSWKYSYCVGTYFGLEYC